MNVRRLALRPEAPAAAFLALLVLVLTLALPPFRTLPNASAILDQACVLGVVALALNQVIMTAEIDIAVASELAVCGFVAAIVGEHTGGIAVPLLAAVGTGMAIGAVHGLLVTLGRVPSIIATLGTQFVLRGVLLATMGGTVLIVPEGTAVLGTDSWGGVRPSIVILVAAFVVFAYLARHTTWGRNVYAVGGNRHAAVTAGLPIAATRFSVFVVCGFATGFAAVVLAGQNGQFQATVATGWELQVIAAVVVGGTSISGGSGSPTTALLGVLLIGVMDNAMTLLSVPGIWQDLVLGALILLAISGDAVRSRVLQNPRLAWRPA